MLRKGRHAASDHAAPPLIWPGMVTMHYCRLNCLAIVLLCLTVGTAEGQSFGRWRMPSTPAQFFGYGYGPGHHAPMVRTPCSTPMSVQRLEVVYPQRGTRNCSHGCADQRSGYGIAPTQPPCYAGGSGVVPPVQSCPCNHSLDLFSAPANPRVPTAPPLDFPEVPSEPTIPEN